MSGGFMLAFLGHEVSLISVAILLSLCFLLVNLLKKRSFPQIETENVLQRLGDGFRFIAKTKNDFTNRPTRKYAWSCHGCKWHVCPE